MIATGSILDRLSKAPASPASPAPPAPAPTTDALLVELQKERAVIQKALESMLHPLDLPGNFTDRQKQRERERREQLARHVTLCGTLAEQLGKALTTRSTVTPQRDRLLAVKAQIEEMQTKQDRDNRNGLGASLAAIVLGVHNVNGKPALPHPLREMLTDTCPTCGHAEVLWAGPLEQLEEQIRKADAVIATMPGSLVSLRSSVKPWLEMTK